jgi:putative transferase (TIGR04331 family)
MSNKTLITTAIEETWPNGKNSGVFLGEWCRIYNRKEIWEKIGCEIVPYHWDDRNKLINDYAYLIKLQEKLLVKLAMKLNEIHNVNYDGRFWRILIGNWLGYFTQIVFDRWYMLMIVSKNETKFSKKVLLGEEECFIPFDFDQFLEYFISDEWNEFIYTEIIKFSFSTQFNLVKSAHKEELKNKSNKFKTKKIKIGSIFYYLSTKIYRYFNEKITRNFGCNFFFLNTYLPIVENIKSQLMLGQFPRVWFKDKIKILIVNSDHRNFVIDLEDNNDFEKLLCNLIFKQIPKLYLEGFKEFENKISELSWPINPKVIFTSNSYSHDDIFNYYSGKKTFEGSKLFIGQHGGHFGTNTFAFPEEHQIKIADKFISWGWSDEIRKNILPFGNFKDVKNKKVNVRPNGNALLVLSAFPRQSYCLYAYPISSQYLDYLEDQYNFIKYLPDDIRQKIIIRLYPNDYKWCIKERFDSLNLNLKFDKGQSSISKLMNQSRIYIATYNATTFLETFTLNFPTIVFWNPVHWELNQKADGLFLKLEECGVFHKSPDSAALKLIEIWDNVDDWWESEKVQLALSLFITEFCKKPENFQKSFLDIFKV